MLGAADHAILFRPPEKVREEFHQYPVVGTYEELKNLLLSYLREDAA